MTEPLESATDLFVLRTPGRTAPIPAAVTDLGTVETLGTSEPLYLLRLSAAQPARDAWATITTALGGDGAAFPVLLDSDGSPHYPTGEITVRFNRTPSEDDVKALGVAHQLEPQRVNEFAAQQIVFRPRDPAAEFLPDLVARLTVQPDVRSAWANTLSVFRRGGH